MADRTVFQSISRARLVSAPQASTVFQAACIMTCARSGSVMIRADAGWQLGLFPEHVLRNQVVSNALAPSVTTVSALKRLRPLHSPPPYP